MGSNAPIQMKVAKYSTELLAFITLFFTSALILGTISDSVLGNFDKSTFFGSELIPFAGAHSDEIEGEEGEGEEGEEIEGEEGEGEEGEEGEEIEGEEGEEIEGEEGEEIEGEEGEEIEGDENRTEVGQIAEIAEARVANVLSIESVNPESPIAGVDKVRIDGRTSTSFGDIEVDWGDQKVERGIKISSDSGYGKWRAEHTYGDSSVGDTQIVVKWWDGDPDRFSVNDEKSYTVNVVSPPVSHPTYIEIDPVLDANLNEPITVIGSLIDDETGEGIGNVEVTFDGSGAGGLQSATTNEDGTFEAKGTAPGTVGTGWEVQAHFAGLSEYEAADSVPASYSTQLPSTNNPNPNPTVDNPNPTVDNPNPTVDNPNPTVDNPNPTVDNPIPETDFASPDNPIPPEQPQAWPTDMFLIVGLAAVAIVIAVAVKLAKGKSSKDNLEVVEEVITRGGTEK
jgi:hypothetical protein